MNKKVYLKPAIEIIDLEPSAILCASGLIWDNGKEIKGAVLEDYQNAEDPWAND